MSLLQFASPEGERSHVSAANPLPVAPMAAAGAGGTLANGAETAVAGVAVQVAAASEARRMLVLQNTGAAAVRIGVAGVTATTGFRMAAGDLVVFSGADVPTNAVFAIREGATDSVMLAQEMI